MSYRSFLMGASFLAAATCFAADAARAATEIETVVVTAERREASAQKVSISMTALSAKTLESRHLTDVGSLTKVAPNLIIAEYGGRSTTARIGMRGPYMRDPVASNDPQVGIYLDGTYIARATGANLDMVDLDHVEVLRGPQGTLFGRNTIGGAINIVTQKPTDDFGGWAQVGYGNYNAWNATGAINVPVTDKVDVRLTAQIQQHNGYGHSLLTGESIADQHEIFLRGQTLIYLAPDWELLLEGDYTQDRNNGLIYQTVYAYPSGVAAFAAVSGGQSIFSYMRNDWNNWVRYQHIDGSVWGTSATLTGHLADVTLKSITSWRGNGETVVDGSGGTPYPVTYSTNTPFQPSGRNGHQFTQEFQLYGKAFDDRLDWIAGSFYFQESGREYSPFILTTLAPSVINATGGSVNNSSFAIYAQGTYSLTDALRLKLGARYVNDSRQSTPNPQVWTVGGAFVKCNIAGATYTPGAPYGSNCGVPSPTVHATYAPLQVGLEYDIRDNVMAYAKYNVGYRAGGVSVRATSLAQMAPFSPERRTSWEVGEKGDFFDGHIRVNADAFADNYNSIQLTKTVITGVTVTSITANAGDAFIWGVEGEVTANWDPLTLSATFGTQKAHYTRVDAGTGYTLATPLPFMPEWSGVFGADYAVPLEFGDLNVHGDYQYTGRWYYGVSPASDTGVEYAGGYGTFNANISLTLESGYQINIWGRNLANKFYYNSEDDVSSLGQNVGNPGAPRTFGINFRKDF